jgi:hypothetical protein
VTQLFDIVKLYDDYVHEPILGKWLVYGWDSINNITYGPCRVA